MPNEDQKPDQQSTGNPRLQAALGFTAGDLEKAKKMIAGEFNDLFVVKGKYAVHSAGYFGNYMLFVNTSGAYLNVSLIAYTNREIFDTYNPVIGWKEYYKTCERIASSAALINVDDLIPHLVASLEGYDAATDICSNDESNTSSTISDILSKFYASNTVENVLNIEQTSSLAMLDERIPMSSIETPKQKSADEGPQPGDQRPEIEKTAQFVVDAKAIVSPLKGKLVKDLQIGERIILMLVNRDAASLKIAEALGALDESRNFLPMKGKLVEKIPVEKIGYYLYCAVAKNALAKIPEEGNVQIETPDEAKRITIDDVKKSEKSINSNIILYVALLIGLAIIAGIFIYVLL